MLTYARLARVGLAPEVGLISAYITLSMPMKRGAYQCMHHLVNAYQEDLSVPI